MRYLRCFKFSDRVIKKTNLYPYNVLQNKSSELLLFDPITIIYGDNGSGKSSFLNLLACMLKLEGSEKPRSFCVWTDPFADYMEESIITYEQDDVGKKSLLPAHSRYLKSEDILYEVKKIQQEAVLKEGYLYQRKQLGMTKERLKAHNGSFEMETQLDRRTFSQEKYSNGETALHVFEDYLQPDGLYLLDEPEVSLAPEKQLELAELINHATRFLNCQFIIATHSPLLLAKLEAVIYDFNQAGIMTKRWTELPSVEVYRNLFH